MCGRYNFSKDSSSEMVQEVIENLQSRQIEVKTGAVFPGDVAAVIASNRKLEPQAFGMKWGYKQSASNGYWELIEQAQFICNTMTKGTEDD